MKIGVYLMTGSVKGKLISFTGGLIIFTMLVTSFVIYNQLGEGIETSVEESATATTEDADQFIQAYLHRFKTIVAMMAEDNRTIGSITEGDEELWSSLTTAHTSFMNREQGAQATYYGTAEGDMRTTPMLELSADYDPRTRPWYEEAVTNVGEVIWTSPYIDADTEELVITAAKSITPTPDSDQVLGVMAVDLSLDEMVSLLESKEVGYGGQLALIDTEGVIIAHGDPSQVGNNLAEDTQLNAIVESADTKGSLKNNGETIYYDEIDGYGWKVMSIYNDDLLYAELDNTRNTFIIVSIIAVIFAFLASFYVANKLTKPIQRLNDQVKKMAQGDFSKDLNVKGKDEISQLGVSVNEMSKELRHLVGSIQGSASDCKVMAEELSAVSEETLATSDDMSSAVNEVAVGASKQAEDMEEANQQMQHLSGQVGRATEQTNQMNKVSMDIRKANEKGLTQMNVLTDRTSATRQVFSNVDQAVDQLMKKVSDIGSVVDTISDFADQTNLLALNASIEAARAGEHGKGFAVVADEVRKLAEQSMSATGRIRGTLDEVEGETKRVVDAMTTANGMSNDQKQAVEDTGASLQSIVKYIETLSQSLEELTKDLNGVNDQKSQIVEAMASIAQVSEGAAATAEEVSASAAEQTKAIETVGKTSEQLNDLSTELQEKTNRFKINNG